MANSVGIGNSFQKEIWLSSDRGDIVSFYASPEVEESATSIYISLDDIRAPASIQIWMGSPSRTFSINAKLISRTQAEAQESVKQKSFLQAWRMPRGSGIGIGTGAVGDTSIPEIITLSGYGNQFNQIPVIIQSLNIQFPTDVDYIDSGSGFMVPIVWPISVTLREFRSDTDMENFNYESFKAGTLDGWS